MTHPAPISATLIVKNESANIERCLLSIRPYVKEIIVVDTGSTDSTPEICKKYADFFEVYTGCNDSDGKIIDFSDARRRSLSHCTQPWIFWLDGDDIVVGAEDFNSVIEKVDKDRNGNSCSVMFPYEYSRDQYGNVECTHYRERLVTKRDDFYWKGVVHEVLIPKPNVFVEQYKYDSIKIIHMRNFLNKNIESGRNLRILKKYYEKNHESDVRMLYYIGIEYGNNNDKGTALKFLKRYIELSHWDEERFQAAYKICQHYMDFSDYLNAIEWALKAITIMEKACEPYFVLSKCYYFLAQQGGPDSFRNWERSVYFAKVGLSMPPRETILFVNPLDRNYDIHLYYNLALYRTGDVVGALESVNTALVCRPDDKNLLYNKKTYESEIKKLNFHKSLNELCNSGVISDDKFNMIKSIVDPDYIIFNTDSVNNSLYEFVSDDQQKQKLVIYTGNGFERWDPDTFKQNGIGGSETAVIEMAKRLVKRGYDVTVYNDCASSGKIYDGVLYKHYSECRDIKCDIFISSRKPFIFDDEYKIDAAVKMCWVHDIHCGSELNHTRALKIDRFLVLSTWHKEFFLNHHKCVHPQQVIVTRNGVDVSRFKNKNIRRDSKRAIYSSSPDRGMEVAIRSWPEIIKRVPGATLHIYYGFDNWEKSAIAQNDTNQLELIRRYKTMIDEYNKYGVFFHGRVNQQELANSFLSSGVWVYPTYFSETSCITAMEAQSAGLFTVTSPIAALTETVKIIEKHVNNKYITSSKFINGDWLSDKYMDKFIESVVHYMTNDENKTVSVDNDFREEISNTAHLLYDYESLADSWVDMFNSVKNEVSVNVVPPYQKAFYQ